MNGGSNGGSAGGGSIGNGNSNGPSTSGGSPDPVAVFDDEMNEKLKDCWVEDLNELDIVTNWEGEHTEATWSNNPQSILSLDPDVKWSVSSANKGLNGVTGYDDNLVLRTYIFPQ
ncbi:MAG: hypothetical protein OXH84_00450 [Gammaproteobacteria bacterium]|nr:hypothetical protein [Gammaproteobacteria bacterium]